MQEFPDSDLDVSFKSLFVPLTTTKAITWIIVIGIIVYANMLFNGFVWDDKLAILSNPDFISHTNFLKSNIFNLGGQYRPLTYLFFYIEYSIFGNTSFFYHFAQLVIHIINASLLFIFFKKFINKNISFLLSIIFLVHPIQVESVSYIASSENPLFFLFGVSALLLSFKEKIDFKRIAFISLLLLCSFLIKETGFLFLFIILLFRFMFYKSYNRRFLFFCLLAFILYCFIRFIIGGVYFSQPELIPVERLSFIGRLINIPEIIFYYIKTVLFPWQLVIDQLWIVKTITFSMFYIPLLIDLLFFLVLFFIAIYIKHHGKHFKPYIFFFLWFVIGLGLHLQIVPLDLTVADKWFYFPFVGLLGMLGLFITSINAKKINLTQIGFVTAVFCILLLSLRTVIRNTNWVDALTLYEHDSRMSTNFDLENNLGIEYDHARQYNKAIKYFKNSVILFPYETNLYNLGYTYGETGNKQEAEFYYFKALGAQNYLTPGHRHNLDLYVQLGSLLLFSNNYNAAQDVLKLSLKDYPTSWALLSLLAATEYQLHNQIQALADANQARSIFPSEQNEVLYTNILNKQLNLKP